MSDTTTERITVLLEDATSGPAGAAALAVERLDGSLSKVEASTSAAGRATDSLVAVLAKEGATADETARAWSKLVQELKSYDKAQARKRDRNAAIEASREDSRWLDQAMRAASRIPTELQQAPKALTAGQKAFQAFAKTFGPKATQGLVRTVEVLDKVGPVASRVAPVIAGVGAAAAAIGGVAVVGGAMAAKSFAGAVIEAQAYRESVLDAFKIVRRTEGDADRILAQATATADKIGVDRAEGAGQFLELLSKGYAPKKVETLVLTLGDLGTVDPNASLERLTAGLGKLKATGRLTGEIIQQFSEAGLEASSIYDALAKTTGKSIADVQKAVSAGKIDADVGTQAFIDAVSSQVGGGPAGAAAAKKANDSLSGLLRRVEDIPKNVLFDVAVGPGIDGVKGFLRDVLSFFDASTTSGQRVRKVVGDLFNALITGLTGKSIDTKKGAAGALDAILTSAEGAVPTVKEVAAGVRDIGAAALALVSAGATIKSYADKVGGMWNAMRGMSLGARLLLAPMFGFVTLLPEIIGGVRTLVKLFSGDFKGASEEIAKLNPLSAFTDKLDGIGDAVSSKISGWVESVSTKASEMLTAGATMAANLVAGLVNGITSGAAAAWGAISSLAQGIVDRAKSVLGIKSPSTVLEEVGGYTSQGMQLGIENGTPGVLAASSAMGQGAAAAAVAGIAPANANATGYPANMNAAGGGMIINITFAPVIRVDGARSAAEAREVGSAAAAGSQEEFERMLSVALRRRRASGAL